MNYAIIAAGEGSRLASEGVELPKPLVDLDGRPMLGRLVDIMAECDGRSLLIIVNEEMEAVADYIARDIMLAGKMPVGMLVKSTPDSMHSFYELSAMLPPGKFVLTTVDTIFDPKAFAAYVDVFEDDDNVDGYMAVTDYIDDEKPLYVEVDDDMFITAFSDTRPENARYVSGGIYGLRAPQAVDVLKECIASGSSRMRNYQRALIAAGLRLKAYPMGKIVDVDHAGDIDKARQLINSYR